MMAPRTEKQPTKPRASTPFDEAQAAWRKIDRLQKQIAEIRAGLSPTALALLDTAVDLERAEGDEEACSE